MSPEELRNLRIKCLEMAGNVKEAEFFYYFVICADDPWALRLAKKSCVNCYRAMSLIREHFLCPRCLKQEEAFERSQIAASECKKKSEGYY